MKLIGIVILSLMEFMLMIGNNHLQLQPEGGRIQNGNVTGEGVPEPEDDGAEAEDALMVISCRDQQQFCLSTMNNNCHSSRCHVVVF